MLCRCICFLVFSLPTICGSYNKILLKDVSALTLYKNKFTTGRRNSPVPQLVCIGGSAGCGSHAPAVVQCTNRGFDGVETQWECKANLGQLYELGSIQVTCEGYDYPDDPFILKGSCGLEYSLEYSSPAKGDYGKDQFKRAAKQDNQNSMSYIVVIGGLVLMYYIYKTCLRDNGNRMPSERRDAPPPPGFRSEYFDDAPKFDTMGPSRAQSDGQGPGFFSGMAAGGTLGYLFGRSSAPTSHHASSYSAFSSQEPSFGTTSDTKNDDSENHTSTSYGGTKRR